MSQLSEAGLWYIQGQWEAFDRILFYLNTLENRTIDKHTIYGAVMQMRPIKKENND